MTEQKWIDPASCSHRTTYVGLVRTPSGLHQRVLRRDHFDAERPWSYYPSSEEGGPKCAADDAVSELVEIDPFVHHRLKEVKSEKRRVELELQGVRHELERATLHLNYQAELREGSILPLTEERVRELAREEINKTSWELRGLTINTRKES